jgi:hypothetical protein
VAGPRGSQPKITGVPIAVVSAECSGFEPSCHETAEYLRSCGAAVDEIRLGEWPAHGPALRGRSRLSREVSRVVSQYHEHPRRVPCDKLKLVPD